MVSCPIPFGKLGFSCRTPCEAHRLCELVLEHCGGDSLAQLYNAWTFPTNYLSVASKRLSRCGPFSVGPCLARIVRQVLLRT